MRVSGAYWRGKEENAQMQRILGVAFSTEKELRQHLAMLEEAKKRDHRKLGQELDLFTFSDLVGSGLPMFTPRGAQLRKALEDYSYELRSRCGFEQVWTPHITKKDLYETSGHWAKFGDELFLVKSQETSDEMVLRPMNCPHHVQIFASQQRSYRDLPISYMENATVYRDEKSGELHGLSRVRSITMDDNHAFVRDDQIEGVVSALIEAQREMYAALDMKLSFRLSYRDDSDGYLGDKKLWDSAQQQIKKLAEANELNYYEAEGEAAFYGPKIDCMAHDSLGREWQVATVQLDFVQPERFGLSFISEDGSAKQPVMIHAALLGSLERFLSVYIEHTAGRFPVWLAPEQIRIATVNQEDDTVKFAEEVIEKAKAKSLRIELDNSNESVGKKIRSAEVTKVPYTLVIGQKEVESGNVMPRIRKDIEVDEKQEPIPVDDFLGTVANEAKSRVTHTSMHGHEHHQGA
jgi:threonyl-tRNA synthetase